MGQTVQSGKTESEGVTMARIVRLGAWVAMGLAIAGAVSAQTPAAAPAAAPTPQQQMQQMMEFFKAHYAKHEFHIAMRDGVKLYAQVYTPVAGQFADKGPYPFLMTHTPYSCGSYDNATVQPRVTGDME